MSRTQYIGYHPVGGTDAWGIAERQGHAFAYVVRPDPVRRTRAEAIRAYALPGDYDRARIAGLVRAGRVRVEPMTERRF